MEEAFILQVSLEIGLGGGSECVAYELQRAWLALGVDARVMTSLSTEPEPRQGITYVAPWLTAWGMRARWRHLAAIIAVPLFTLIATWRAYRTRGTKIILSHGDSLIGDVCVVHAVNRASLAEKAARGLLRLAAQSEQSLGDLARLVDASRRTLSTHRGHLRTRRNTVEGTLRRAGRAHRHDPKRH